MGSRYRQAPSDLIRSQIDITNRLEILETNPRAPTTSVDAQSGSAYKFIGVNGVEVIKFGDIGSSQGTGWIFRRGGDSSVAFWLGGNESSGNQFWALNDISGNIVMSDDAQSEQGLGRPYLLYPVMKAPDLTGALGQSTTSTTFVVGYYILGYKQHPVFDLLYTIVTPAGVSAEVQIVDTSTPGSPVIIDGPTTHGPSTFASAVLRGAMDGTHLSRISVELQYRVSSGAGTIGITCNYAYGHQS